MNYYNQMRILRLDKLTALSLSHCWEKDIVSEIDGKVKCYKTSQTIYLFIQGLHKNKTIN